MNYLSDRNLVHRDLAARNCMLDDLLIVKVADFGLSRNIEDKNYYKSERINQKLPIRWMAMESIITNKYDTKSDVWSYGVLIWEIFTRGDLPYFDLATSKVYDYISEGNRLGKPLYCSSKIYDFMYLCWSVEKETRPSFSELAQGLLEFIDQSSESTLNRHYYNEAFHGL